MPIVYQGQTVNLIDQSHLTPGEADAIERATNLTMAKIRRLGETCVCEHGVKSHRHPESEDPAAKVDTSCTACDCEAHMGDVPARVATAFVWVSVKRVHPAVRFIDVSDESYEDLYSEDEDGADAPDPTQPAEPSPEESAS